MATTWPPGARYAFSGEAEGALTSHLCFGSSIKTSRQNSADSFIVGYAAAKNFLSLQIGRQAARARTRDQQITPELEVERDELWVFAARGNGSQSRVGWPFRPLRRAKIKRHAAKKCRWFFV